MFIFQIIAFLILILGISWKSRIRLVEAVPVGSALLILTLYLLAFFRILSFCDVLAVGVMAAAGIYMAGLSGERRRELAGFVRRELLSRSVLTALVMTLVMTVCVSGKLVSWWDDYNFWAADAKAIFYLDGFAHKYRNVAPEFGDYPPGTQLMKWWFLHFSPGQFREGLMFAGYYFLNLSFLFPLLQVLDGRGGERGAWPAALNKTAENPPAAEAGRRPGGIFGNPGKAVWNGICMACGAAVLWLFPSVAEAFWCDGCCADLTMALVYGAFLVSVVDRPGGERTGFGSGRTQESVRPREYGRFFYYGRQALFLMVLVLCKNTGFLWAAFGLLFDYGYHLFLVRGRGAGEALGTDSDAEGRVQAKTGEKAGRARPRGSFWPLAMVTLLPVLTELGWLGFCLANRRVAKLTGTAIQMATGGMNLPAYQEEMVHAFLEAFVKWPLHRGKTPAVDLSPLGLFVLLFVFLLLLWKFRVLGKRLAVYLGGFLALTGTVFYTMNLVSHLTIFAVETQYLEPFGMVSSIERYGAPFAIGGLYLLAFLVTRTDRGRAGALVCAAFVLLTADHGGAFRALWGYRSGTQEILSQREEIIDEAAWSFLRAVNGEGGRGADGGEAGKGKREPIAGRVLYLRDISDVSWVRNTYLGFEASPVSVMYGNLDASQGDPQAVENAIRDAHAEFVYVDELAGEGERLFTPFTGGAPFAWSCLYQVKEEADGLRLVKWTDIQTGTPARTG